ncbi:MAG TPA: hypothetical protein PK858_04960, partial [Saprospiraceae bacterium]|nr:hypothetical protein [Saprospiraceae bacterium]
MDRANLDSVPYVRILVPFAIGIALSDSWDAMPRYLGIVVAVFAAVVYFLSYIKYKHQHRWVFGAV